MQHTHTITHSALWCNAAARSCLLLCVLLLIIAKAYSNNNTLQQRSQQHQQAGLEIPAQVTEMLMMTKKFNFFSVNDRKPLNANIHMSRTVRRTVQ